MSSLLLLMRFRRERVHSSHSGSGQSCSSVAGHGANMSSLTPPGITYSPSTHGIRHSAELAAGELTKMMVHTFAFVHAPLSLCL